MSRQETISIEALVITVKTKQNSNILKNKSDDHKLELPPVITLLIFLTANTPMKAKFISLFLSDVDTFSGV